MVENPFEAPRGETSEQPLRRTSWLSILLRSVMVAGLCFALLMVNDLWFGETASSSTFPETPKQIIDFVAGVGLFVCASVILISGIFWLMNEDSTD